MIQSRDLTYKYQGGPQIRFPDFQVASGEVLLILGESGCGKTTLLHLLAGLRRPTTGQIKLDQQQLTDLPSNALDQFRGQNIGMVYQQSYFIEALSIEENLLLSPYVVDKQRATSIANKLGIGDQLKKLPASLSIGQQQRAAIARAVMNQPKMILADEPTSALDDKNCTYVLNLLREEAVANDAVLIIVTHDNRLKAEVEDFIQLNPL